MISLNRPSARLALLSILAAVPAASAQTTQPATAAGSPVTWCEYPTPNPRWERQTIFFSLGMMSPDSSSASRALRPYLPFLLSGISHEFMAEHQPTRDPLAKTSTSPPPGEPRYEPGHLLDAAVSFDLLGDGRVEAINAEKESPTVLTQDLVSALLSAIARGDVFGPYADSSVRARLVLDVEAGIDASGVRWPAFTLNAPISKPVVADPANKVRRWPRKARNWEGKLMFTYLVDEHGRVVPGTAGVMNGDALQWKSDRQRTAYEAFRSEVIESLLLMRFYPAEEFGCRVKSGVMQQFDFTYSD